ncbi:MAG: hypothetical protein DRR08_10035 [Candidatus Parabeggiatoa sp. nov. 2]|nr:MAG: hypothetical protein B6247_31430 [Beggiatoa sp. 4572_84]RKZ60930.1 MAG: hypothetical protein DRR08_10035 [Gammaproteobacteria bacterium]
MGKIGFLTGFKKVCSCAANTFASIGKWELGIGNWVFAKIFRHTNFMRDWELAIGNWDCLKLKAQKFYRFSGK